MSEPRTRTHSPKSARLCILAAIVATLLVATGALAGCACSSSQSSSSSSSSSASASASAKDKSSSSSSSSHKLQVPNLVSLDQQDATKMLQQMGFKLWEIDKQFSDTVAKDHVISQDPQPGTMTDPDKKIVLVVSAGKQAPADVEVPNIIGMSQSEAEQALANAKLVPVVGSPEVSTAVEPGKVCRQSVVAGTKVAEGSKILFTTALAEGTVAVPSVEGSSYTDAKAALEAAGLGVDPSSAYSDTVPKDSVISQSVPAGTQVVKGTVVKLQVSLGPKPADKVKVPYILTATLQEAIDALTSAGLGYRYSGDEDGTVVFVTPDPGTEVEVGSIVTFTLNHAALLVEVPDVKGKTGADADVAFRKAGLTLDYDVKRPDRVLAGTKPQAGTMVDSRDIIEAVYDDTAA